MASKTLLYLLLLLLLLVFKTRLSTAHSGAVKSIYWFSGSEFPAASINSSLFTHIFCAFAQVDPTSYQLTIAASDAAQFSSFTQTVRRRNPDVKTLLSIGGGSGNTTVLAAMASLPSRRKSFIDSSIALARSNNFHGLDLDWEFPSTPTNMANFGRLLVEWRAAVAVESRRRPRRSPLLLTAAVFRSSNYYSIYAPTRNITNSLDWINVMAYDFYGPPWDFTAPPAGLYNSTLDQVNVNPGLRDWIVSGVPANKLVLGLPFYGYSWLLTNPASNGIFAPARGAAISPPVGDVSYGGIRARVSQNSSWNCVYDSGIVTDYCYAGTTWIGYDDLRSIYVKARYTKRRGLLGCFARQVAADSDWILSTTDKTSDFIHCLMENSHPNHPIAPAIFTPANSSFSSVLWAYIRNNRFNTTETLKPYLIITALHVSHIQASIVCARSLGLQMKIRSGGHDYEGVSYVAQTPFFILDMFNLRSVEVDIKSETAWVQTGATLGEVYYRIAEKSGVHGYPAGVCPSVGVGGHISGAGYGNMMRKYGLTVDNLEDAVVVDVNGRILDRRAMGEDFFWAISGGGGSSFGVVLSYKIKLVRVPERVSVFAVTKTTEQNASFVGSRWQKIADSLDDELFIRFIMHTAEDTTTGKRVPIATFVGFFLGDAETLLTIMTQKFPELGLTGADITETSWIRSVFFWTNINVDAPLETLLSRTPSVPSLKRKSDYINKAISKEGLESIWEKMIELEAPLNLTFNPYGGEMARIPSSSKPFPHRAGNLAKIQYAVNWNGGGTEATEFFIGVTRKLYSYMTPFVTRNPRQAYYNYKDLDLGINGDGRESYEQGRIYGYFLGNFDRLVKIKTRVDPGNFFRNEQSIPVLPTNTYRYDS